MDAWRIVTAAGTMINILIEGLVAATLPLGTILLVVTAIAAGRKSEDSEMPQY